MLPAHLRPSRGAGLVSVVYRSVRIDSDHAHVQRILDHQSKLELAAMGHLDSTSGAYGSNTSETAAGEFRCEFLNQPDEIIADDGGDSPLGLLVPPLIHPISSIIP